MDSYIGSFGSNLKSVKYAKYHTLSLWGVVNHVRGHISRFIPGPFQAAALAFALLFGFGFGGSLEGHPGKARDGVYAI